MKFNWGAGVAAAYIVFAVATSGFVAFAMHRPVSLVRPDYYAESLRADEQLAARANARQLGSAASISTQGHDTVRLTVPRGTQTAPTGTVTFYRASDPAADQTFTFSPDAQGVQHDVKVSTLAAGALDRQAAVDGCRARLLPRTGDRSSVTYLLAGAALGLAGSVHCAGMCGPLLLAVHGGVPRSQMMRRMALYHAARVVMYVLLGIPAGTPRMRSRSAYSGEPSRPLRACC